MSTELPHSNLQRLVSFGRSKIICYLIDDILHLVMIGVQIERNRIGISIFESEKLILIPFQKNLRYIRNCNEKRSSKIKN